MERPTKCYIRQEWFEAVSFLPPEDRCLYYEALLSFVYYGKTGESLPAHIRGIFEMSRNSLQSDMQKYTQKVLTNRQNGRSGGRPRGGITQNNPTKPNQTQTNPNIHLHNKNIIISPQTPLNGAEREKIVLIELFASGVANVLEEGKKMCDYYDARGWVDKGGNAIVDVGALARVWKPVEKSVYYANVRKKWAEFCRSCRDIFDPVMITDFLRMDRKTIDNKPMAVIYCKTQAFREYIETNCLNTLRVAIKAWQVQGIIYTIESA